MKVIIAGSRNFKYHDINQWGRDVYITLPMTGVYELIDEAMAETGYSILVSEVVSGSANGVDITAEYWANKNNIKIERFPADWGRYNKSAGFIRNSQMAKYADALVAIWDGSSSGTAHMIKEMQKLRKPTEVFVFDSETALLTRKKMTQPYPDPVALSQLFDKK